MVRLSRSLLPFLMILCVGCAVTRVLDDAPPFGVMTYNIRLDLATDGGDAWPHRKEEVASMIRFHGGDLVGLQEALPHQLDDLEVLLPDFDRTGHGRDTDLGGEHSAILYRRERFELLESDTFWLSETPELAGSKGWDAAYPRIVTWGRFRDRLTDRTFFHFNTHLDHLGEEARRKSAKLLVRRMGLIAGETASILLTGDFNVPPGSEPYETIVEAGLRDAIDLSEASHHGPTSTWNGFQEIEPRRRIDFIFVKGAFRVARHGVLSDRFDRGFPSDHLAVFAEVGIER